MKQWIKDRYPNSSPEWRKLVEYAYRKQSIYRQEIIRLPYTTNDYMYICTCMHMLNTCEETVGKGGKR